MTERQPGRERRRGQMTTEQAIFNMRGSSPRVLGQGFLPLPDNRHYTLTDEGLYVEPFGKEIGRPPTREEMATAKNYKQIKYQQKHG